MPLLLDLSLDYSCFYIAQVYGLDINPRAIKAAWINLYLNALNEDGSPVLDQEGKTLLDRVEFHESDLLQYCMTNKISLDRHSAGLTGKESSIHFCLLFHFRSIPTSKDLDKSNELCFMQILNPDPHAMQKIVSENASEEFLYSLSNYCALQVTL